jgi:hypothetical protein
VRALSLRRVHGLAQPLSWRWRMRLAEGNVAAVTAAFRTYHDVAIELYAGPIGAVAEAERC